MCRLEANGNEEGESGGDNRGEMFSTADKALLCIIGFGCMTGAILFGILYFVRGWHGMEVPPRFMIPVFAFGVCILLGVWRNKIDILLSTAVPQLLRTAQAEDSQWVQSSWARDNY